MADKGANKEGADKGGQFNFSNFGNGAWVGAMNNPQQEQPKVVQKKKKKDREQPRKQEMYYQPPPPPPMESHSLSYSYSTGYPYPYYPPPYTYTHTSSRGPYGYSQPGFGGYPSPYGAYPTPHGYPPQLPPHGAYPPLGGGGNPAIGYSANQGGNDASSVGAATWSATPTGKTCFTAPKDEGITAEAAASCQATATAN